MADRNDAVIALLTRIADGIDKLVAQQQRNAPPAIATDKDLDGRFGDPEVRMRVRDWSGPDMKGKRMSQCPAAFLDLLAETLEWAAGKADANHETTDSGKPVGQYRRADAARARGWAQRIRDGKVAQPAQDQGDDWGEDSTGAGW